MFNTLYRSRLSSCAIGRCKKWKTSTTAFYVRLEVGTFDVCAPSDWA